MSLDFYLQKDGDLVFSSNITHNLNTMAEAAGIYKHLWHPEDIGVTKASELIKPLRAGAKELMERPTHFETFNSPNGWGLYVHFLPFVARILEACIAYPDADVSTST